MSAGARNRSYATHIGCIHELSRYRGCRNGMAEARVRSLSIQLPAQSERPILSLPLAFFFCIGQVWLFVSYPAYTISLA